jgi:archaellin
VALGVIGMTLVVVAGIFATVIIKAQPAQYSTSQIQLTKEACQQATGTECVLVTCDYIPEGKTFEEMCGNNFREHWIPTQNPPTTPVSGVTPEPTGQSNISIVSQLLGLKGQATTAKGYAIFATTSCEFKTPQHNPSPGFSEPCARDSGYVVLSDKPYQLSQKFDPTKNVTTLSNDKVLVFYVTDKVVAGVQLGDLYEFNGETTTYNGQPGIRYQP